MSSSHIQTTPVDKSSLHPMITRSKAGIFKKKNFEAYSTTLSAEPSGVQEALLSTEWKNAMTEEYNALMKNQMWILFLQVLR